MIASLHIGSVIGAVSNAVLSKFLPYWYLFLSSLVVFILGFVLYALATTGWLVVLANLLSGISSGIRMSLTLAYISESNVVYRVTLKELGEDSEKATRVKHRLFAIDTVGYTIGQILGPGIPTFLLTVQYNILTLNDYYILT